MFYEYLVFFAIDRNRNISSARKASERRRVANSKFTANTEYVSVSAQSTTIPVATGAGIPENDLSGLVDKVVDAMTPRLIEIFNCRLRVCRLR